MFKGDGVVHVELYGRLVFLVGSWVTPLDKLQLYHKKGVGKFRVIVYTSLSNVFQKKELRV